MIYLCVIKSLEKKYRYVGITKNLEKRISQHNNGYGVSTKFYAPFKIILVEEYLDYHEARQREKFLKSGTGRNHLDSLE